MDGPMATEQGGVKTCVHFLGLPQTFVGDLEPDS